MNQTQQTDRNLATPLATTTLAQQRLPIAKDFVEEEKILKTVRTSLNYEASSSSSILGETLEVMNMPQLAQTLPAAPMATVEGFKVPGYAIPAIGGIFIIMVFCTMIGALILQPNTAQLKKIRKKAE